MNKEEIKEAIWGKKEQQWENKQLKKMEVPLRNNIFDYYKNDSAEVMTQEEHFESMFRNDTEKENFELRQQLTQVNNKIEKIKEIPNVIDKMIYEGYMNGKEGLMATYENSEFGIRAKIIKAKLLSIIDGSDE